jgi:hypothetical protein
VLDSCWRGAKFESRLEHCPHRCFRAVPQSLQATVGTQTRLGCDHFQITFNSSPLDAGQSSYISVQRRDTCCSAGVLFPAGTTELYLLHSVYSDSGARQDSYKIYIGDSLPGMESRPGREADHSPTSNAEVKNAGAISLFPITPS